MDTSILGSDFQIKMTWLNAYAGLGMGGSGCGRECMDTASTIARTGLMCFVGGIIAATLSIISSWAYRRPEGKTWITVIMTAINIPMIAVSSVGVMFLKGF